MTPVSSQLQSLAAKKWTARMNIQNYEKRLRTEREPGKRRVLKEMLAQQQHILADEMSESPGRRVR
jgi:hypothetical protein